MPCWRRRQARPPRCRSSNQNDCTDGASKATHASRNSLASRAATAPALVATLRPRDARLLPEETLDVVLGGEPLPPTNLLQNHRVRVVADALFAKLRPRDRLDGLLRVDLAAVEQRVANGEVRALGGRAPGLLVVACRDLFAQRGAVGFGPRGQRALLGDFLPSSRRGREEGVSAKAWRAECAPRHETRAFVP